MPHMKINPYEIFRQVAYEELEAEPFDETTGKIELVKQGLGSLPLSATGVYDHFASGLWSKGGKPVRTLMTIDSISLNSPPYWRVRDQDYDPHFTSPSELIETAIKTNDIPLLIRCLGAVADVYRVRWGNVPYGLGNWAVEFSRVTDKKLHPKIIESVEGIKFSWMHIDTADFDDLHPVVLMLGEDVDIDLRRALLNGACLDADTTDYKTMTWRSQMDNTYRYIANRAKDPLRFECRIKLGLPESDKEYKKHLELEKTERDKVIRAKAELRRKTLQDDREAATTADLENRKIVDNAIAKVLGD